MKLRLSDFRYIALTARAISVSEEAQAKRPYPWREAGIESFRRDLADAHTACEELGLTAVYERAIKYGKSRLGLQSLA